METIETEIEIDAPVETVWEVITDLDAYHEWNPFIPTASGDPRVGERIRIRVEPPGSFGGTFRPRVEVHEPNRRLVWLGRLGLPGLFDGRHELAAESLSESRTRFVQRETFSGLLVPLFFREDAVRRGYESMNAALKERAETRERRAERSRRASIAPSARGDADQHEREEGDREPATRLGREELRDRSEQIEPERLSEREQQ